jgi:hypothetical protein
MASAGVGLAFRMQAVLMPYEFRNPNLVWNAIIACPAGTGRIFFRFRSLYRGQRSPEINGRSERTGSLARLPQLFVWDETTKNRYLYTLSGDEAGTSQDLQP